MADLKTSRESWEEKATENTAWYISPYSSHHNRDMDGFWQSGNTIWAALKRAKEHGSCPLTAAALVLDVACRQVVFAGKAR